jgi:diadenylate cyclase
VELFKIGFLSFTVVDFLDIVLVTFLFYQLYGIMRGTIAAQIFVGLLLIIAFSFFAQALNLKAMGWLLRTLTDIWVIAFIILFQPELRRLLLIVGRNRFVRMFLRLDVSGSVEEIADAAVELAKKRHGALLVITRATGVRMYTETGQSLQAVVSKPLLLSIFHPRSPLHDGAVIVKDTVIEAARCTLPLSQVTRFGDMSLGMRHRAALGISEQADVIAVVVSEETGTISIAENGELMRDISATNLRKELRSRLTQYPEKTAKSIWGSLRSNA